MDQDKKFEKIISLIKEDAPNEKIKSFFKYHFRNHDREEFRRKCWQNEGTYLDVEWQLLMALYWEI